MYDSVFVLSSGRITSIGPQGEFNWQVREVGGEGWGEVVGGGGGEREREKVMVGKEGKRKEKREERETEGLRVREKGGKEEGRW